MELQLVIAQVSAFLAVVLGGWALRPPPRITDWGVDDRLESRRRELAAAQPVYSLRLAMARFFARYCQPYVSQEQLDQTAYQLRRAGDPQALHPLEFYGLWVGYGVIAAVAFGLFCAWIGGLAMLLAGLPAGLLTAFLGVQSCESYGDARVRRIERRLPYVMDVLGLAVGAGSSLIKAMELVADQDLDEPLDDEIRTALAETAVGRTRREATDAMIARTGSDDLAFTWNAITQSEELGVPIAKTIALQAKALRQRRIQRAEKAANEAGMKILAPAVPIMVAVLLLLLGPMVYTAVREGFAG